MKLSPSVPLLSIGLILAMIFAIQTLRKKEKISEQATSSGWILIGTFSFGGLGSTAIAYQGWYLEYATLFLVGIGFATPFSLVGVWVLLSSKFRSGLYELSQAVPLTWLTNIQAVRILAVGSIGKYLNGSLPGHFILPVGVPDFLIGLTAPLMAYLAFSRKAISPKILMAWHLVGSLLYVPAIPLMHLSVPSPIQMVFDGPNTTEVLSFPMVLVPSFVVPLYLLFHGIAIWKLWEQIHQSAFPARERTSRQISNNTFQERDEIPSHPPIAHSLKGQNKGGKPWHHSPSYQ